MELLCAAGGDAGDPRLAEAERRDLQLGEGESPLGELIAKPPLRDVGPVDDQGGKRQDNKGEAEREPGEKAAIHGRSLATFG